METCGAITAAPEQPPGSAGAALETQPAQSRAFACLKKPFQQHSHPPPAFLYCDIAVCYSSLFRWVLKPIFFENPSFKVGENIRQGCNLSAWQHRLWIEV